MKKFSGKWGGLHGLVFVLVCVFFFKLDFLGCQEVVFRVICDFSKHQLLHKYRPAGFLIQHPFDVTCR